MQHKLAAQVRSLLPKSFELLGILSVRQEACNDIWLFALSDGAKSMQCIQ